MTKEEFATIAIALRSVYVRDGFLTSGTAMNVWYSVLGCLTRDEAADAVRAHIVTSPYPPTPADILRLAGKVGGDDDGAAAWSAVRRAISNSLYHANEEFARLPDAAKAVVGNASTLRTWALCDVGELETVIASNFKREYKAVCKDGAVKRIGGDKGLLRLGEDK